MCVSSELQCVEVGFVEGVVLITIVFVDGLEIVYPPTDVPKVQLDVRFEVLFELVEQRLRHPTFAYPTEFIPNIE